MFRGGNYNLIMKEFGDGNIKPSESSWFGFLRELENVTLDNIFVQVCGVFLFVFLSLN